MIAADLRSDTVTKPTPEMRLAMARAEVGDDVYGDDPTVNRLQDMAADLLGKEAALFVPSGTMGNQLAVMTHTQRGDEVVLDAQSHIIYYEAGAMAVLSGVQPQAVAGDRGFVTAPVFDQALRGNDIHFPPTRLVCLENTHNRRGGTVMQKQEIDDLCAAARDKGIAVHMDGARIFNAAAYLDISAASLVEHVDSVMFCLSKGLASPIGSMLVGSREWIDRAHRNRKILGGALRQVGVLAACGIVSLLRMIDRLQEDHDNAHYLAEELNNLPGMSVDMESVQTNIVMADIDRSDITAEQLDAALRSAGVLVNAVGDRRLRAVTHNDVDRAGISEALAIWARVMGEM